MSWQVKYALANFAKEGPSIAEHLGGDASRDFDTLVADIDIERKIPFGDSGRGEGPLGLAAKEKVNQVDSARFAGAVTVSRKGLSRPKRTCRRK